MKTISRETANRLFNVCEAWLAWMDSDGSNLPKGLTPIQHEENMIEEMRAATKEAKSPAEVHSRPVNEFSDV